MKIFKLFGESTEHLHFSNHISFKEMANDVSTINVGALLTVSFNYLTCRKYTIVQKYRTTFIIVVAILVLFLNTKRIGVKSNSKHIQRW